MDDWKTYIGAKLVKAVPFVTIQNGMKCEGYTVVSPDEYRSWCPKVVFEAAYLEIGDDKHLNPSTVKRFITDTSVVKMGRKTTVMTATLANGFELVASYSCFDPEQYDEGYGASQCGLKIYEQVRNLLRFCTQLANNGFTPGAGVKVKQSPTMEPLDLKTPHEVIEDGLKGLADEPTKQRVDPEAPIESWTVSGPEMSPGEKPEVVFRRLAPQQRLEEVKAASSHHLEYAKTKAIEEAEAAMADILKYCVTGARWFVLNRENPPPADEQE